MAGSDKDQGHKMKLKHACWRFFLASIGLAVATAAAHEYHVSVNGSDANDGSPPKPYRTISAAARVAQPGDVITVHEGVYRERISPPRSGQSDRKRIVYQAAPGEKVQIKGSEVVTNWVKVQEEVWKATLPNAFFGGFNPYNDLIHGDWFSPKGRQHHTGAVYLNGDWLTEAANLDDVLKPAATNALWFGQVDKENTTIWAQFQGVNPNEQLVEINVRRTVFYPEKTGMNFITVRGFALRDAATPWAPPTAEQIGLIGTHWSKGWIIESNLISHSTCSGIALGKYGDEWDNRGQSMEGYIATIRRSQTAGTRPPSAITWSATMTSRTANRPASWAASARRSAPSPAIVSTRFMCGSCSAARRWPASSCMAP
jgi:alpha-N-arabinofuranosidase